MKNNTEVWRDIVGFENWYQVSNLGRVRNLRYRSGKKLLFRSEPRILKPSKNEGYWRVSLGGKCYLVHTLVLRAFVGPAPKGYEAAHLDGDRANARLNNLKWVTRKENHAHKWIHGTQQAGEQGTAAKLTTNDVLQIRELRSQGAKLMELAIRFGVSEVGISQIVNRKTWKHV